MKPTLLLSLTACLAHAQPDPAKAGPEIIAEASGKLIAALTEAIAKEGAAGAIGFCSERAPEIAAGVGKAHGVSLRRASEKPRHPKNAATEAERILLAAFTADLENGKKPAPRLVTNPDGAAVFQAPIVIPGPLCLQCHGDPAKDIAPETLTAIRKLYPDDKATGYKTGDLRGAWSVTFQPQP